MVNRQNTILWITAIFFSLIFHEISFSQSPTWAWAKSGQGIYHDWVEDMFIDISGNCLITGKLQSNSVIFGTDTLIDQGPFVVKYSTTGDVIWAKSFHDYGGGGFGIASDADNNIYITGYFGLSGIQFDSISLNSLGSSDIYIAKLDSNGNVLWAESAGTINADLGSTISVDTSGNIYLAGIYDNAPITFDSITLNNDYGSDIFVTKYNSAGNVLWARSINGDEQDGISNISVDRNGDIILCGDYKSSYLHFGTDTIFNLSSGSTDIFLAKYDANGNFMWSNSIGGYSWDRCKDMNISSNNQIYLIGGYISPYFTIDSINTINHLQGFDDVFILKYDSNGSFIWTRTLGGSSFDSGRGITSDSLENLYITGIYNSMQIDFGATILSNNNPSDFKIFVAKYDSSGNENWVLNLGTSDDNWSKRIKNYNNESIYVTGTFNSNNINIGPFNITGTSNSNHTIFTAKLTDISTSAVELNDLQSLAVYPNPNSGKFSISNEKAENLKITVQNIQGEIISISESSLYSIDFDLKSLRPGVYILRIESYKHFYRNEKVVIY